MEVFHSIGQEGLLSICLDGGEPVRLNFKQNVQVCVSYSSSKDGNVNDGNGQLKTEPLALGNDDDDDIQKKPDSDPVNEELNIYIERAKNDGKGNEEFSKTAEDLFGSVSRTTKSDGDGCSDAKKICVRNEDVNVKRNEKNGVMDDDDEEENAMDMDGDDFVDDDMNDEDFVNIGVKDADGGGDKVGVTTRKKSLRAKSDCKVNEGGIVLRSQVKKCETDLKAKEKMSKVKAKEVNSSPKGKCSNSERDDLIAKLIREVEEKKRSIKLMSAANATLAKESNSRLKPKPTKTAVYKCNLCDKKFTDSIMLTTHHRAETAKVKCKSCDLECTSTANLLIHEHLMHSKNGRKAGKVCPVCSMRFEKHTDILSHVRTEHTKEGVYKCCVCHELFQGYQPFKLHLDKHYSEKLRNEAKNVLQKGEQKAKQVEKVSSASKRKSHTPMQHKSSINQQSTSRASLPPLPPLPPLPYTGKVGMKTPLRPSAIKTPVVKSASKSGAKLVVKVPSSSLSLLSKSKASASYTSIKKQVLASRLKPTLTPSMLASRKRQLNQLPGSPRPSSKLASTRASLKTLPRVSLADAAALKKKKKRGYSDKLWKCHFCERVFRTKGEYIQHKKPSKIIQLCKTCGFTSTSKALYMIHEYQKHTHRHCDRYVVSNQDLKCHICEEPVALNDVLKHVMSKHTGEHPYECCVCKKPSMEYEDWVKHGKCHIRTQDEKDSISNKLLLNLTVKMEDNQQNHEIFCNLCKQYHPSEKEFVRHHKSETEKRVCEICRLMCYTQAGYLIHKHITHGLSAEGSHEMTSNSYWESARMWHEDDSANDMNEENTKCPSCQESFPMKDLLAHVMNAHTQESPYKCCTCKATLSSLDKYIDHCNFHLGKKIYPRGTQRCLTCGLRFEQRIRLSRHKVMHKPSCPYCHVEFNSKALMDVHLKNYHQKDMTPCGFCGKLFAESNQLAEHERNHYFYKKSPCPVCGLSVTNVNKHMARVHPKPDTQFLCNLCGKKFPLQCDLTRHMGKHTSDRRHECDICKKTFKRPSGLRRHAQSHLQDRTYYECHICGKKCSQRNNLSVHMRVHSASKAYTCEHCGQGFNYNQSLQTHLRKKHMDELSLSGAVQPPSATVTSTSASAMATATATTVQQEPPTLNVRRTKPPPAETSNSSNMVSEPIHQLMNTNSNHSSVVMSPPPTNLVPAPLVNYQDHPIIPPGGGVYPHADSSQHYYPDPYVPVNAMAFHRSYNDLINTIVRSEHDNSSNHSNNNHPSGSNNSNNNHHQSNVPQQGYPVYYPQF